MYWIFLDMQSVTTGLAHQNTLGEIMSRYKSQSSFLMIYLDSTWSLLSNDGIDFIFKTILQYFMNFHIIYFMSS